MARRKKLTIENLTVLGPEPLARLLLDEAARNKVLKRELDLLLTAKEGPEAVAREVRKRINTLARSRSFFDWHRIRELERDLNQQYRIIVEKIAPADAGLALDLMWRFLDLAQSTFERCDDSDGIIGELFRQAVEDSGPIAVSASVEAKGLADAVIVRLQANHYGIYDDLVTSMFPALGKAGIARLKERVNAWRQEVENESIPAEEDCRSRGRRDHDRYVIQHCLQALADAEGDVDAFIATYDERSLKNPVFASRIAWRLIAASRAEEALTCLDRASPKADFGLQEWHDARIAALIATGDTTEAQLLRWQMFERTLIERYLRDYLKVLPDFDDVEAEEKALAWVEAFNDVHRALTFLVNWPALERAARLVISRNTEIDGNLYYLLAPAADALDGKFPLASVMLRRALIEDTLNGAKSTRYKHAARHVLEIESLNSQITEYAPHEDHAAFMSRLRRKHVRKQSFWDRLT